MLKHAKGNLIDMAEAGQFNIIVQGCNCFNTMGSGIAKEIRMRYPDAYVVDIEYSRDFNDISNYKKLGNYSVMLGKQFNIVNCYTQYRFNSGGKNEDVFEYAAFELILRKLVHQYPGCSFGLPYIGCGLAGGDKARIIELITDFAKNIEKTGGSVTLVEFG